MPEATLTVRSEDHVDRVVIDPGGLVIGRHDACDVVLDDPAISRRHVRVYQDPFGRWIVEDLGSRNGLWYEGERVPAQAVGPGDEVTIGPFALTIDDQPTEQAQTEAAFSAQATLVEDSFSRAEMLSKVQRDETLSSDRLKQLNQLAEKLVTLPSADKLYPAVCQEVASAPETVSLVLRLPAGDVPLPDAPDALSFCSGGVTPEKLPHNLALHVSRRVLEAVRKTLSAVMAGAATDDGQRMDLTIVDDRKPRAVLAAPIGQIGESVEVLYLDVPADRASESLLDYVQAVARQANFIRKSLQLAQARAERASLDRQLSFARQIQQRLTPPRTLAAGDLTTAVHYQPAMWVGGDYCDVWALADGRLAWAIGDVSGKGLPAALVMATLHGALRTSLSFRADLASAITALNDHLVSHTPEGMFVTLIAGFFDPSTGVLEYVNAGHGLPLRLDSDGAVLLGEPTNPPVGILDHPYAADRHELPAGATLLAVTDGVIESTSTEGELYGEERLQALAGECVADSPEALVDAVAAAAEDFRKPLGPQDDTTVLAINRAAEA